MYTCGEDRWPQSGIKFVRKNRIFSVKTKPGYGRAGSPDYVRVSSEQHEQSPVWERAEQLIEVRSSLVRLLLV